MKTRFITTLVLAICISTSYSAQVKKKVTVKKSKVEAVNKDSVEHAALEEKARKGDANAQNSLGIRYYTGKYVKQDFSKAITWWAAAAKQKHVEATANMGLCYQFGNGIKQDSIMAVKLYKTSIKMGNTKLVKEREELVAKKFNMFDSNLLADIYSKGIGVTKDTQKALKYYLLSAKNGNVDACIAGAKIYENNQSYPEAYKLFNSVASKNNFASYKVGEYLVKGFGTKVDKAKAVNYLSKAAKNNIPNAMILLGDLYYQGDGVEKDMKKSVDLYKSASLTGSYLTYWNIGIIYAKGGYGVDKDFNSAINWLALASKHGFKKPFQEKLLAKPETEKDGWAGTDFATFVEGLDKLYGNGKDIDAAFKLFQQLEKKKVAIASTMIALCYSDKDWKKANEKKAVKYLEKAVEADDALACYELAKRYKEGNGVEANKTKAIDLMEKADNLGNAKAMAELGDMYYNGKMVGKDVTKAIQYYIKGFTNGYLNANGAKILSDCYAKGIGGLPKDQDKAKIVLEKVTPSDALSNLLNDIRFK